MKIHEKNDYESPQMQIFLLEEDDVITSSGDTDVDFNDGTSMTSLSEIGG